MDTPEETEFTEDEMELEDTAVTADDEQADTGFIARSVDDEDVVLSTEDEFSQEAEDGQEGFELALDEPNEENEPPVLPDVAAPPDAEVFSEGPYAAETIAASDVPEMDDTTEDEIFVDQQPTDQAEDPFLAEAADEEVFPDEGLEYEESATEGEEIDSTMTTPINVEAVMEDESPQAEEMDAESDEESTEADISDADTQDITEKVSSPESADEIESTGLSDDDVDRIARRLLELAGDRIEHIAWDVIPDMAELVVRERVQEIEATAEHERS